VDSSTFYAAGSAGAGKLVDVKMGVVDGLLVECHAKRALQGPTSGGIE
jgi:hypothetical protein